MSDLTASQSSKDILRPKAHFTAEETWINDPNGLLFFEGVYHLFYQNNPFGSSWGNMSWGHAISTDLITWEHLAVAIPHKRGDAVFSGSAVVDYANTAGFAASGETALVAIYTSDAPGNQSQALAYSVDAGATWTRYEGNPVLDIGSSEFRDPKVFWHGSENHGHWVMAVVEAVERQVLIYTSADLKNWEYASSFGPAHAVDGSWECPDLFPLVVAGEKTEKWVMLVSLNRGTVVGGGSGTQYFVGEFDGQTFTADELSSSEEREDYDWLDYGADCYAGVTFNNAPDGRRILIAWANNWLYATKTPTSPWRGAMTFARELTLQRNTAGELKLRSTPVLPEKRAVVLKKKFMVDASEDTRIELSSESGEDVVSLEFREGRVFVERGDSGNVTFSPKFIKRWSAPIPEGFEKFSVLFIADASVIEVYIADGLLPITLQAFPSSPWNSLGKSLL